MRTEIYINIKDLVKECVKKIWIIIIAMIIFSVLLTGYKYSKDKKAAQSADSSKNESVDIDSLTKDMSKDDLDAVMSYVNLYNYKDQQEDFTSDSEIMQINPYKADTMTLQYYVSSSSDTVKKDMSSAYLAYISGGALASDVIEDSGISDTARNIQELIQCDATGMTTGVSFYTENTNVINVFVYGTDENKCKQLSESVKKCLAAYSSKMSKVAEHTFTLFEEQYSVTASSKLISLKNDRFGNLSSYNTKVTDYESYLSDSQLADAKKIIAAQEDDHTDKDSSKENVSDINVRISKKYVVVGAFLGLVLAVIIIIFRYIFDPSIKNEKDLQVFYGANYIGNVSDVSNIKFVVAKLISLCESKDTKTVTLAGMVSDKDKKIIDDVAKEIESKGIKTVIIGDILTDAEAVEQLDSGDKLVLLETVRKNKYEEYTQQKLLCESLGVECMGYVAIAK
ncbi:MAG: hypothetical protein PUD10_04830 [Lachnospira sp.]|nr:hypothetical protein [Lachnospira sp.]